MSRRSPAPGRCSPSCRNAPSHRPGRPAVPLPTEPAPCWCSESEQGFARSRGLAPLTCRGRGTSHPTNQHGSRGPAKGPAGKPSVDRPTLAGRLATCPRGMAVKTRLAVSRVSRSSRKDCRDPQDSTAGGTHLLSSREEAGSPTSTRPPAQHSVLPWSGVSFFSLLQPG